MLYIIICTISGRVGELPKGYLFYTIDYNIEEYGYERGDTLILQENKDSFKTNSIYLLETGDSRYTLSTNPSKGTIGVVEGKVNIFKKVCSIYNSIISTIKTLI